MKLSAGHPLPLGATVTDEGVNFAVFSRHAANVVLELFAKEGDDAPKSTFFLDPVENRTGDIWHCFVQGVKAGALYLYRAEGPFRPADGFRFNKNAHLLDPYAHAVTFESICAHLDTAGVHPLNQSEIDRASVLGAAGFPKCVVVEDTFDWQGDRRLNYPLKEIILYEVHVKNLSCGAGAASKYPGTYRGVVEKIPYLKDLGVTSLELLPVHEFDEREMCTLNPKTGERLTNFWGYSTVAFFAPKAGYAASKKPGAAVTEFKEMVRELHKAGIEVILDVVFNHTAEGNERGPTISFRGLDNSVYYMLEERKEYYRNYSGCGNTLNCNHPVVRNLVVDCLRYWVLEMHVDGFRFDLGTVLNRGRNGDLFSPAPLVEAIADDPILSGTKLIAEPWDAGGGYQVGNFNKKHWSEWNDRYRDEMRRFWHGEEGFNRFAATRFGGSEDLYALSGRKPYHSLNYITCHDGFTLNDVVSYNSKHNDLNGESNRDGSDNNNSYNYGFEGATSNPVIEAVRVRQIKNMFLSLMLSQGTPMILGGDEFRRTKHGNNNTYCQDNELSWFDWSALTKNAEVFRFFRLAIHYRRTHPAFRRPEFFRGKDHSGDNIPDIHWCNQGGKSIDWEKTKGFLAFFIDGKASEILSAVDDDDFYVVCNPDQKDASVMLPPLKGKTWCRVVDTSIPSPNDFLESGREESLGGQKVYILPARSMAVFIAKK